MPKIKPLEPPDSLHLLAAQGWLELGNHLEANEDLEKITANLRAHPAVLFVRWHVYAMAKRWEMCIELAKALTTILPDMEHGWVNLGNSLYFHGRTQEAYDCVKPLLDRFSKNPFLPYNLACYSCQLGKLEEAKSWLVKAFELDPTKTLELTALDDPDLKPLWREIGNI